MSLVVAANSKPYEMKAKWRTLFEVILIVLIIVFAFKHEEQQANINSLQTENKQLKLDYYLELHRQDSLKHFFVVDGVVRIQSANSIKSLIGTKTISRINLIKGKTVKNNYGMNADQIAISIETKKEQEIDSLVFH
ncbi:MAG: hypothetical protein GY816_16760 [Cytophagales bacterium]|nr:hypothetical protein [Cytophagales bacterium]